MSADKCPHCGVGLWSTEPRGIFMCGTPNHDGSPQALLCRERAAHAETRRQLDEERKSHAETLNKLVLATGLISELMPYLRHTHPRCRIACECGLNAIIVAAGIAAAKALRKEGSN